jgi:excisionase family DNA binding protein
MHPDAGSCTNTPVPTERQRRRREKQPPGAIDAPPPATPAPAHLVEAVREAMAHAIDDEIADEHAALAHAGPPRAPRARRARRGEWLTVSEAAALLGVSRPTLYRRAARGALRLERDAPTGTLRMSRAELARVRSLPQNLGGRPPALAGDVRPRIARMRADGMSLAAIADRLNAEQVPTAHGGARWWPSTVRAVLGIRRSASGTSAGGPDDAPVCPSSDRR